MQHHVTMTLANRPRPFHAARVFLSALAGERACPCTRGLAAKNRLQVSEHVLYILCVGRMSSLHQSLCGKAAHSCQTIEQKAPLTHRHSIARLCLLDATTAVPIVAVAASYCVAS